MISITMLKMHRNLWPNKECPKQTEKLRRIETKLLKLVAATCHDEQKSVNKLWGFCNKQKS